MSFVRFARQRHVQGDLGNFSGTDGNGSLAGGNGDSDDFNNGNTDGRDFVSVSSAPANWQVSDGDWAKAAMRATVS